MENLEDGSVEMEAQGEEEQIDALIQYLNSQRYISIERIRVRKMPLEEERGFYEKGY